MGEKNTDEELGRQIGERLREVRGREPRVVVQAKTGISPSSLANYENGRLPDPAFIVRFCEAFGINEAWLLTGRGPKLREPQSRNLLEQAYGVGESQASFRANLQAPEGYFLVPVFDVAASSGHGTFPTPSEDREPLAFPITQLRRLSSSTFEKLFVVFNRGDSNEPDIYDGDVMLVDRGIERLADDAFYVFEFEGALMVKLIERMLDGRVALKSRNPAYREEILSKDDAARLRVFGRVVWRGGLV